MNVTYARASQAVVVARYLEMSIATAKKGPYHND